MAVIIIFRPVICQVVYINIFNWTIFNIINFVDIFSLQHFRQILGMTRTNRSEEIPCSHPTDGNSEIRVIRLLLSLRTTSQALIEEE